MDLKHAIELLKNAVKYTGNIDQKHIDLTLVPVAEKQRYEAALKFVTEAMKSGEISRDEVFRRLDLD